MKKAGALFFLSSILADVVFAQHIEIVSDHTNGLYACGEEARFSIRAYANTERQSPLKDGVLSISLTNNGWTELKKSNFQLATTDVAVISGSLKAPGFMMCRVSYQGSSKTNMTWGVAFDPHQIRPGSTKPADFDAFWDQSMAKLEREVALDPRVEKLEKYSCESYESFLVSFATFDQQRVYGYLCIPKKAKQPMPVLVQVPGAGPGVSAPMTGLASRGIITLMMNVHLFAPVTGDSEAQKKVYDAFNDEVKKREGVERYCVSSALTRETYFYYRVILGVNRAVNWVAARPDVDRTRFWYSGTSQGGGFGFYLCGLNRHFTQGVSHVPALTDLLGYTQQRTSGWPRLVEAYPEAKKDAVARVAPYFDGAHFATRITCPYAVSIGFIDSTCPPTACYAGYNSLRVAQKRVVHGLGMPHRVFPEIYRALDFQ